jgi:hypothetical protein
VADYFRANNMEYELVAFEKADEVVAAYDAGRCDVFTTDQSGLYAQRLKLKNPGEHKVLPEIISKEPLGPVVRQGDDQWFNVVKWVHFALVNAEELGVTQANVDEMKNGENPSVKRLLGTEGDFGTPLSACRRMGLQRHQGHRQLRRNLRPQCRPGHAARHRARRQRPLVEGRPDVRPADPLIDIILHPAAKRPGEFLFEVGKCHFS